MREILHDHLNDSGKDHGFDITENATLAIQTASEDFLTSVFEDSNLCAIHGGCTRVKPRDFHLALRIARFDR